MTQPYSSLQKDGGTATSLPRVLIAEDEFLLAYMLEEDLRGEGFAIVGPFTRLSDAVEAAGREDFEVAVLDINMNGEMAFPIADVLLARGIPFVFLSGYGNTTLPDRLKGVPCVSKPCEPQVLLVEVKRLVSARH